MKTLHQLVVEHVKVAEFRGYLARDYVIVRRDERFVCIRKDEWVRLREQVDAAFEEVA